MAEVVMADEDLLPVAEDPDPDPPAPTPKIVVEPTMVEKVELPLV